ncbi:hypothetical protein TgHK011_004576 [Trichoderma gracile]|nr:hypothetical protein TgHK011_004576 [Trichoderma gracile]
MQVLFLSHLDSPKFVLLRRLTRRKDSTPVASQRLPTTGGKDRIETRPMSMVEAPETGSRHYRAMRYRYAAGELWGSMYWSIAVYGHRSQQTIADGTPKLPETLRIIRVPEAAGLVLASTLDTWTSGEKMSSVDAGSRKRLDLEAPDTSPARRDLGRR